MCICTPLGVTMETLMMMVGRRCSALGPAVTTALLVLQMCAEACSCVYSLPGRGGAGPGRRLVICMHLVHSRIFVEVTNEAGALGMFGIENSNFLAVGRPGSES